MYFYYNTATFDREYYVSRKLFVINNNYVLEITVGRYAEILTWSPIRKPQLITSDLRCKYTCLIFYGKRVSWNRKTQLRV